MEFSLKHDYHIHTRLSKCSNDPEQNPESILKFAEENGFSAICLTDHFWDENVPGAVPWYAAQDYAHISKSLPLPKSDKVRFLFGCENEYCGGDLVALSKEKYDKFDFIIIPPNHYHMKQVRDPAITDPRDVANLFTRRLNELTRNPLPWEKVGIAHITDGLVYREGNKADVYSLCDEGELRRAFSFFAEHGTGIELNDYCFRDEWGISEEGLRIYRIAKSEGCLFYRGSDAHHPSSLIIHDGIKRAVELLGLTSDDQYTVPEG